MPTFFFGKRSILTNSATSFDEPIEKVSNPDGKGFDRGYAQALTFERQFVHLRLIFLR